MLFPEDYNRLCNNFTTVSSLALQGPRQRTETKYAMMVCIRTNKETETHIPRHMDMYMFLYECTEIAGISTTAMTCWGSFSKSSRSSIAGACGPTPSEEKNGPRDARESQRAHAASPKLALAQCTTKTRKKDRDVESEREREGESRGGRTGVFFI